MGHPPAPAQSPTPLTPAPPSPPETITRKRPASVLVRAPPPSSVSAPRASPATSTQPGTVQLPHPLRPTLSSALAVTPQALTRVGPAPALVDVRLTPHASPLIRIAHRPATLILGTVPPRSAPCACLRTANPHRLPRDLWSLVILPSVHTLPCSAPGHSAPTPTHRDPGSVSPPRQRARLHTQDVRLVGPTPGNHVFHLPSLSLCCSAPVHWPSPAALRGRCSTCYLCVTKHPRVLPRPLAPHHPTPGWLPNLSKGSLAPIHPADYRYTSVRHLPSHPDLVAVCRLDQPVAVIHVHVARWLRHQCLLRLLRVRGLAVHEGDVVVHILDALLQAPQATSAHFHQSPPHVPDRFLGDRHLFMAWDDYSQPGSSFPASLPTPASSCGVGCPASSAFTPLASLPFAAPPLVRTAYESVFAEDPLLPYFCNGVRYGFSLGVQRAPTGPRPPRTDAFHPDQPTVDTMAVELDVGACVPTSLLAADVPLRFAPWYAVDKTSGGHRGVGDLSWGVDSVNEHSTRPTSLLGRPPLSQWPVVAGRFRAMRRLRPGVPIVVYKLDASRAFRTLGIPARDLHLQCHQVGQASVCSVRSEMGAVASGDHCCALSGAIEAAAASSPRRLFCSSYVDDQLGMSWADTADGDLEYLRGLWSDLGWTLNAKKFLLEGAISQQLTFLGVLLNTFTGTASITPARRQALLAQLDALLPSTAADTANFVSSLATLAAQPGRDAVPSVSLPYRDLASLVGKLSFCASIVPMGRAFLRSLQTATGSSSHPTGPHSPRAARVIHLDPSATSDLRFWQWYLRTTPGVAHFDPPPASGPTLHAGTDASKHGWGGLCESLGVYTAGRWTTAERAGSSTAHWEALAAVMLSASLAPWATGGTLHLACDSGATVAALNASRARDPQMHSLCQLFAAVQILGCFNVTIYHLPGRLNTCPDLLSRGVPASRLPLPRASRLRRLSIPHSIRWCGVLTRGQSLSPPSQGRPPTTPPSTPGGPTAQTSVFHAPLGTPWRWPLWQAPTPQPIPTTRTASTGLPTWGGCSATGPGANPSPSPATSAPFAATSY